MGENRLYLSYHGHDSIRILTVRDFIPFQKRSQQCGRKGVRFPFCERESHRTIFSNLPIDSPTTTIDKLKAGQHSVLLRQKQRGRRVSSHRRSSQKFQCTWL